MSTSPMGMSGLNKERENLKKYQTKRYICPFEIYTLDVSCLLNIKQI